MGRRPGRSSSSKFDPTLSRGIIAVVLVIAAIIITLSFFNKAGSLGMMLVDLLNYLFGLIRFTVPAIILILAWFLVRDRDIEYNYRLTHCIGAVLFFLALSSIMHLKYDTSDMLHEALNGRGGGLFGMLAWPLKSYLGLIASWVLLSGLCVVSTILIFNASIAQFIVLNKKLFFGLGSACVMLARSVKLLFVRKPDSVKFGVDGAYEDHEEEDDNGEDEPHKRRKFFRRGIGGEEYGDEDSEAEREEGSGSCEEEHVEDDGKDKNDVWSKKVVIKNLPSINLLSNKKGKPTSGDIKANAQAIKDTLMEFGIDSTMGDVKVGPTVTQYSLKPAKGIKLTRITSLANDLALALAAHPIRIEAPIPGKSLVGIEVPNERAALVSFKELIENKEFRSRTNNMMIALGKDVAGKVWFADLPRMPHLLIAGATGSGKTVCMNSVIMSLIFQNTAETLRMIMVDPKRVELTLYNGIPHLLTPVITNIHKTVNALKWTISEMDRRFEVLSQTRCRDIFSYNKKYINNKMPHIVFIIDELADLMAGAANEVEAGIIRLAQMARAVGIYLVVATQRPSVDVITGLMKANIPARIAFSVASLVDSRTILDSPGAEKLLGRGDMLFQTAELSKPVRLQGALISEEEIKNVVDYLRVGEAPEYDESIVQKQGDGGTLNLFGGPSDDVDSLFLEAKNLIIESGKASASFLQRRMKIGYARAARILDELESAGIIGPAHGAKPREILAPRDSASNTMDAGGEHNVFLDSSEDDNDESFDNELGEEEGDGNYDDNCEEDVYDENDEDEDKGAKYLD